MTTTLLDQLLFLMDDAFEGKDWESLLGNLKPVTADDWLWVAPGGRRSIHDIVHHVGSCKFMYDNQAFGDRSFTWDDPLVRGDGRVDTMESTIEWLREGHARLRASIAALDDSQLTILTGHHSGKPKEARWVIWQMIQHDLYHAGEINYIRALHQGNDG